MASTIAVPTLAQLANYPPKIAQALIDFATQAQSDVNTLQGGGVAGAAPVHFVRAVTTAALAANTYTAGTQTLQANSNGALGAIDGVTLAAGDRLLVNNESTGSNNGIYVVTSAGGAGKYLLTRAVDCSTSADLQSGMLVAVSEGTANADSAWLLTTNTSTGIVLDTTALSFSKACSVNTLKREARRSQASTGSAVTEDVFFEATCGMTITAVHYLPSATSTPASGSNNQVLTVNKRDGVGGAPAQVAQATLANGTPMTAWIPFDLGTITNGTLAAGNILTFNTALTGTATLPSGSITVIYSLF